MNTMPWNYWSDDGIAKPETSAVIESLDRVLEAEPDHPLALHLYIHALEASNDPGRAEAAADRLASLVPGAAISYICPLIFIIESVATMTRHWRTSVQQRLTKPTSPPAMRRVFILLYIIPTTFTSFGRRQQCRAKRLEHRKCSPCGC